MLNRQFEEQDHTSNLSRGSAVPGCYHNATTDRRRVHASLIIFYFVNKSFNYILVGGVLGYCGILTLTFQTNFQFPYKVLKVFYFNLHILEMTKINNINNINNTRSRERQKTWMGSFKVRISYTEHKINIQSVT